MQLRFDDEVEAFRAEFVAFLDEHLPAEAEAAAERSRSTSHVPEWSRRWQRLQFDHGWLLPGNPPEFGGRNANILEQFVHREELSRRRIYHAFNPQGVGIIAASLLSFGTEEQKQRWAVPILRAEITASLGMSEPGAGSDLAGLTHARRARRRPLRRQRPEGVDVRRPRRRRHPRLRAHRSRRAQAQGDQRTADSDRHPRRDLPAVRLRVRPRRPRLQRGLPDRRRVPAENLVGPLHGGWKVANGSLGHERTMMWLQFANRLGQTLESFRPVGALQRDQYATHRHGLSGAAPAGFGGAWRRPRAARATSPGFRCSRCSGRRPSRTPTGTSLEATGADGLSDPAMTAPYNPYSPGQFTAGWFTRYIGSFAGTIAGGTSEIQRNIIA